MTSALLFSFQRSRLVSVAAFALCLANVLCAAEPGHACASITDDGARLACYDREFGSPYLPSNGAPPDGQPATRSAPADVKKEFSFSAFVTGIERRRDGMFVVTLDNAQAWSQTEINTRIEIRAGDSVRIRRGALGSYLLSTGEGLATRVKRVR